MKLRLSVGPRLALVSYGETHLRRSDPQTCLPSVSCLFSVASPYSNGVLLHDRQCLRKMANGISHGHMLPPLKLSTPLPTQQVMTTRVTSDQKYAPPWATLASKWHWVHHPFPLGLPLLASSSSRYQHDFPSSALFPTFPVPPLCRSSMQ